MLKRLLFVLLWPGLCLAQLESITNSWKLDKDLENAAIGFCVLDARTSSVVAQYNAQLALVPASTLKVLTTSAALGILGTSFRYDTKIYYTGAFNKQTGLLNGDLVIAGSGDPTLQSENFLTGDSSLITDTWAKLLGEKGIKEITGSIVGDASYFAHEVPDTWIWSDIGNYFGTVPCGLSFMDNKFSIWYNSGAAGSTADVQSISPNYQQRPITVASNVKAQGSEDEAYVYGDPFSFAKEVSGKIPPNRKHYGVEAALPDPALLCAEMLKASLAKVGIVCRQQAVSNYKKADTLVNKQLLHTQYSPTLDRIVLYTNLKSNNLYCESLLRTLGKGDARAGIEAVKNYWQGRGLNMSEVFMSDGSGLSRANTVTTNLQARLLSKMYRDSTLYKSFYASLPIAGKSGSMASLGKGTPIENNMHAKTGYINRARGYCGYVKTKSGRDLAFSVLFNNYNCNAREAKLKIEKFLIELYKL